MSSVNVLVTLAIGEECLHRIAAVSPEVKVWDASTMVSAEQSGDFSSREKLDALLAQTGVIYGFRPPKGVLNRAPGLEWIQCMLAGVDHFLDADMVRSRVIVTNSRGIHATQVSELALQFMLMFAKRAPFCFRLKQEKKWERFIPAVLRFKTLGIVGMGSIGTELARLAKALGMRVVAVRRSVKRPRRARYADLVLPPKQLPELLAQSDFVVLSLPLIPETDRLIGERELRAMKPTAYLINVGRGETLNEEALVRALSESWIAGAGLDVFAREPLPADSRLWELSNVIFTPHVAGRIEDYNVRATELFCENLRRYLKGQRLLNVVNKKRGY